MRRSRNSFHLIRLTAYALRLRFVSAEPSRASRASPSLPLKGKAIGCAYTSVPPLCKGRWRGSPSRKGCRSIGRLQPLSHLTVTAPLAQGRWRGLPSRKGCRLIGRLQPLSHLTVTAPLAQGSQACVGGRCAVRCRSAKSVLLFCACPPHPARWHFATFPSRGRHGCADVPPQIRTAQAKQTRKQPPGFPDGCCAVISFTRGPRFALFRRSRMPARSYRRAAADTRARRCPSRSHSFCSSDPRPASYS